MQRILFTADLHFGHEKVIAYCGRPFVSAREMDETLVARWNARVTDEDLIYVLGDFAKDAEHGLGLVRMLKGKKVLIAGNHDICHSRYDGAIVARERYLSSGWSDVIESKVIDVGTLRLLLHHYPYVGNPAFPERDPGELIYAPKDEGLWLLHGHAHDLWKTRGRMINVGVDCWNFWPVCLEEVLDIVARGESSASV